MARPLGELEKLCRDIAQRIDIALGNTRTNKQTGFALMLFDFGGGGNMTYVSNAERGDMIKALYEQIAALQHNVDQPPLHAGRQERKG